MTERLARWISILFDSSFLSLPIFLVFGYLSSEYVGVLWALGILLIVTGIPLTYMLIGRKKGWISDMELSNRSDRPRFILVSLSSDVLALAILWFAKGPQLLFLLILTYFLLAIVMFTVSNYWKISMHMAGVSGFSTALVFVFGDLAFLAFLSLPLVAWARLERRKHTPAQLGAGALAGILVAALVFGLIMYLFDMH